MYLIASLRSPHKNILLNVLFLTQMIHSTYVKKIIQYKLQNGLCSKPSKTIFTLRKRKTEKEQTPLKSSLHHVSFVSCQPQLIMILFIKFSCPYVQRLFWWSLNRPTLSLTCLCPCCFSPAENFCSLNYSKGQL